MKPWIHSGLLAVGILLMSVQLALGQCNNSSAFGFVTAPLNTIATVTTCQFAGEYHEIGGCAAARTYISASSFPTDFLTVRRGTPGGPVVASGTTPLTWTTTTAGSYFVHVNLNSGCGVDFSCHTLTIEHACATPAPTAVTATPTTVCAGQSSNVRATSAGNVIHWFTVSSGGVAIGTSANGANFTVNPAFTTTYYASAFNGTCFSARTPVTVTVNPSPTITGIGANPDTVCIGSPANLRATTCGQTNTFAGPFAPANWTTAHVPVTDVGIVYTAGAPNSIAIESSDGGNFGIHSVFWTATMPCTGTVSFHWDYVTTDVDGSDFDYPEYAINMVNQGYLPGFVPGGPNSQSGNFAIGVTAGQQFSLIMTASDDILGPATTVYSNFSAPGSTNTATINWFTVPVGGTSLGSSLAGANFPVSPLVTTTYYAAATFGGCTSTPRVPIVVVAQNCILPIEDVVLHGLTDGNVNSLFWSQMADGPAVAYDVERSADGQSFLSIASVASGQQEGEEVDFGFEDNSPFPADNYYRLRYIGPDGVLTYSNTVRMRLADALGSFSLAPSPTADITTYRFLASIAYEVRIDVLDLLGRKVLHVENGVDEGPNAVQIDLSQLPAGSYTIRAYHSGIQAAHTGRVVKVD